MVLPTKIQITVLAPFSCDFSMIYQHCVLTGSDIFVDNDTPMVTSFENLQICRVISPSEVLIIIGSNLRTCVHRGDCAWVGFAYVCS
jgi:hypothetical protein